MTLRKSCLAALPALCIFLLFGGTFMMFKDSILEMEYNARPTMFASLSNFTNGFQSSRKDKPVTDSACETTKTEVSTKLQPCSSPAGDQPRRIKVEEKWFPLLMLERQHPELEDGGSWRPSTCRPLQRVALVVPVRDRHIHLRIMLHHMHPFLQRQNIAYTIFFIEQSHGAAFNRGLLLNIGFKEAMDSGDYDCIIVHDLDMLPEDDRIPYTCANMPRHMAEARSKENYKLQSSNMTILTVPVGIGRYRDVWHTHPAEGNFRRRRMLVRTAATRKFKDGLNTLSEGKMYEIIGKEKTRLFTWILVDIHKDATLKLSRMIKSRQNHNFAKFI